MLPFATRIWFAWLCFFRVLFDGAFAARAFAVREGIPELPAADEPAEAEAPPEPEAADVTAALQLLALLQREGRFVDFIQQDVESFEDAEIGAAARVVHDGCRKALKGHLEIQPVRNEEEGARLTLEAGFDAAAVKLTGNVSGTAPYDGTLKHRGWRAKKLELPAVVGDFDPHVLAPAEVEL